MVHMGARHTTCVRGGWGAQGVLGCLLHTVQAGDGGGVRQGCGVVGERGVCAALHCHLSAPSALSRCEPSKTSHSHALSDPQVLRASALAKVSPFLDPHQVGAPVG